MTVSFDAAQCTCEHAPACHDDGFGCTHEGCECLAGYSWAPDVTP